MSWDLDSALTTVVRCGMAPDTPTPFGPDPLGPLSFLAEALPDGLLPPTHPRGPRSLSFLANNPVPKPPTERGWRDDAELIEARRPDGSWAPIGIVTYNPVALWAEMRVTPDHRAIDRTFENETRLHR